MEKENCINKKIKNLKMKGYEPNIIILEWTSIVLLIDDIKTIYPNCKYIASEQDVTFQSFERGMLYEKNIIKKTYKYLAYINLKKREIIALNKCNSVIVLNSKDKILLIDSGMEKEKIFEIHPYYHKSLVDYDRCNNNIVFYGNMRRIENISAVNWFIDKVFCKLNTDKVKFIVVGAHGNETINRRIKGVEVLGFIDSIDKIFSESMCFIAPLLIGAGIKIKCLEAMYSGIPVLTNKIGIEGINAKDGLDFYYCETPDDYINVINKLIKVKRSEVDGKNFIESNFDYEKSLELYNELLDCSK